jgi:hypothetical protein
MHIPMPRIAHESHMAYFQWDPLDLIFAIHNILRLLHVYMNIKLLKYEDTK